MDSNQPDRPRARITAHMLKDIGLFGGLDDDSLALLSRELPTEHVEAGATVVAEGDLTREMFVVIAGELEVVKEARSGQEVRVALFGPGDWFGEMSILDVQPRSATVRAVAPTMLLRIDSEHVERLLYRRDVKAHAMLMMNIARELSRRLRVADGIIAQMMTSVSEAYIAAQKRTAEPRQRPGGGGAID
jgi:CRP/FNR family transcriptional regulator, cyclic AMP receptor protein